MYLPVHARDPQGSCPGVELLGHGQAHLPFSNEVVSISAPAVSACSSDHTAHPFFPFFISWK